MAAGTPTSVRGNAVPAGGQTAQQPIEPSMTPDDIKALVEHLLSGPTAKFREASTRQYVKLQDQTLALGQTQASIPILNVGLGSHIVAHHRAVFTVTSTNAAATVLNFGRWFPFVLDTDITVAINGGGEVYSCTGIGDFLVSVRGRQGARSNTSIYGTQVGLPQGIVRVSFGSGFGTVTNSGLYVSGIASVGVPINLAANNTITVDWYRKHKFVFSEDTLLGALPLQNNQTSANLMRTVAGSLAPAAGTANNLCFQTLPASVTVALTSYTVNSTYVFWSLPGDPSLYAELISNAYKVQEQRQNTVSATGPNALVYNIPQNEFVTAMHVWAYDGNGVYLVPLTAFNGFLNLVYAGGNLRPVNRPVDQMLYEQQLRYIDFMGDMPGYLLFDGNDTAEEISQSDDAGWLDTYLAGQPQLIVDVASGIVTPITYNVVRESVVPGAVVQVGG